MSVASRPAGRSRVKTRPKSVWKRRLKVVFSVFFVLFGVAFVFGSLEAFKRLEKAKGLVPQLDTVMEEMNNSPSEILSADGQVLFRVQKEYRQAVPLEKVPDVVKNAVLAAEDKRFYDHPGVDIIALGRIAYVALKSGDQSQGGSTLTMQIAKQVYTGSEKTVERKLDDMAMAIELEKFYSKDQILELYLNRSYFGEGAYGIVAAADVYFGKDLDELTIAEAAMLARCVRRPSDENPIENLEKAIRNRDTVLKIMFDEKMISEDEYQAALNEEVKLRESKPTVLTAFKRSPYFVDYVLKQLRREGIDIRSGGYKVYTTLNFKLQKIAEERVKASLARNERYRVNRMGFLAADKRGRILCMVPDTDYEKRQFNVIDSVPGRQPGSAFKPFVYAAGLEMGAFTERSRISTRPYMIKDDRGQTRPVKGGVNAGGGSIGIATALAASNNTAAVQAQALIGTENVIQVAERAFGMRGTRLVHSETLALGSSEVLMTELLGAYSVFQNGGDRMTAYAIERIQMPDGRMVSMQPPVRKQVISASTADAMDRFLRYSAVSGTGRAAAVVKNVRGKTGTTSSNKDAWFCGYTDEIVAICWMARSVPLAGGAGNVARSSYLMGGTGAAPAWGDIVKRIQDELKEEARTFQGAPVVGSGDPLGEDADNDDDAPTGVDEEPPTNGGAVVAPPLPGDPDYRGITGGGGQTPPVVRDPDTGGGSTPPPTGNGEDVVYVSVCADSGQRSNVYCREAVRRPYVKGTEPRGACPVHGP